MPPPLLVFVVEEPVSANRSVDPNSQNPGIGSDGVWAGDKILTDDFAESGVGARLAAPLISFPVAESAAVPGIELTTWLPVVLEKAELTVGATAATERPEPADTISNPTQLRQTTSDEDDPTLSLAQTPLALTAPALPPPSLPSFPLPPLPSAVPTAPAPAPGASLDPGPTALAPGLAAPPPRPAPIAFTAQFIAHEATGVDASPARSEHSGRAAPPLLPDLGPIEPVAPASSPLASLPDSPAREPLPSDPAPPTIPEAANTPLKPLPVANPGAGAHSDAQDGDAKSQAATGLQHPAGSTNSPGTNLGGGTQSGGDPSTNHRFGEPPIGERELKSADAPAVERTQDSFQGLIAAERSSGPGEGAARSPEAAAVSAPLPEPDVPVERLTAPPKELVVTIPGAQDGDSALASVHVRDQNGAVEIAVRTPDSRLSTSLQESLPDLVTRLEAHGTQASATRGDSQDNSRREGSGDAQDRPRERPPQDQPRGQPGDSRAERQARWQASLGAAAGPQVIPIRN